MADVKMMDKKMVDKMMRKTGGFTNTPMFDKKMHEACFTYNSLARRMGVTNTTIRSKAQNRGTSAPFTVAEILHQESVRPYRRRITQDVREVI